MVSLQVVRLCGNQAPPQICRDGRIAIAGFELGEKGSGRGMDRRITRVEQHRLDRVSRRYDIFRRAPVNLDTILTSLENGKPVQEALTAHI